MTNKLVLALDRSGWLQTARWNDVGQFEKMRVTSRAHSGGSSPAPALYDCDPFASSPTNDQPRLGIESVASCETVQR